MLVDIDRMPMNIMRPAQGMIDHPCANSGIGETIDQNKVARVPVITVTVEHDRRLGRNIADADLVHLQGSCRLLRETIDIDGIFQRCNGRADAIDLCAADIAPPRYHGLFVKPDHMRHELISQMGPVLRSDKHVATR